MVLQCCMSEFLQHMLNSNGLGIRNAVACLYVCQLLCVLRGPRMPNDKAYTVKDNRSPKYRGICWDFGKEYPCQNTCAKRLS